MCELWMHPAYDNLYIALTSKKGKYQPQTNIFNGILNPFPIEPTVVLVKISERNINFSILKLPYHRLANRETYFFTKKILQNFE